ncbi:hypothetical protein BZARG_03360 [Bizionia argentinensis JUB59]|uniref:Uncharacterized protein n=1 Tax=Bizionia argentinensis JUB59 TaxID=1046627 RepID=A0A4U8UGC2_9FLAO|nr:hypothetical protein BZARG_03360 [Bizionia argentinensis JUB59]
MSTNICLLPGVFVINLYFYSAINHYKYIMKRLIVSVLMLMAATLIFSQANDSLDENASQKEVIKKAETSTIVG